jgi:hypothetical protein
MIGEVAGFLLDTRLMFKTNFGRKREKERGKSNIFDHPRGLEAQWKGGEAWGSVKGSPGFEFSLARTPGSGKRW